MKFNSLKEFWEWLTISTGDLEIDYKAITAYKESEDFILTTWDQKDMISHYRLLLFRVYNEQQELELK